MEMRNLGRSGLQVSIAGLGCNNFGQRVDLETARAVVHKALDLGITLLDTADIYGGRGGSEEALGQILGARRRDVVLASKFGMAMSDDGRKIGGSRRYIMQAVEDSLRRLKTDWIDLYQMHQLDPQTPIEETLRALDDLVRSGKVRYIGCSNFPAWRMAAAQETAHRLGTERFITFQDELSLVARAIEKDVIPCGSAYGMSLLPYFPLASGLLTGKYKNGELVAGGRLTREARHKDKYMTEHNLRLVDRLTDYATGRGHNMLTLAMSWLASNPLVGSVIAGATKPEQVEQNVAAVGWRMTPQERDEIDAVVRS